MKIEAMIYLYEEHIQQVGVSNNDASDKEIKCFDNNL
jgi:hypothetical protein